MEFNHDIIIIGAGISGINVAYHVQTELPNYSYIILEEREAMGGTWDLFQYPGIRSDSDLITYGFSWYPWNQSRPIAEGKAIATYIKEAAAQFGIDQHIHFQHRVTQAAWSDTKQKWTLIVEHAGLEKLYTATFVAFGTGYYDYNQPLPADIPGMDQFTGTLIHPQFWPKEVNYTDQKIVVIGSGATAVTLIPKLAETAERVTMLQRSPTYILSVPNAEIKKTWIDYLLPRTIAQSYHRLSWFLPHRLFFLFCQSFPQFSGWLLRWRMIKELPDNISHDPHFSPRYAPWDQRLCVSPDGDFYRALYTGKVDIKTDSIEAVTSSGIKLKSGEFLDADIIITATGLKLQLAGGVKLEINKEPCILAEKYLWRGIMLQDVPNAFFFIGYTNASWTLGVDASAAFSTRLIKHLSSKDATAAVPRVPDRLKLQPRRVLDLSSTYITKADKNMPKAADQGSWLPRNNYISDLWFAKYGRLNDLEIITQRRGGKD
ncbi:monooxygenase [Aspergillus nomiae NRRL 13137]|uniref:Monooxygenase n=1 Tax=Aspergillus nomiae NRRL (strain ATCC 15546 / NRRL 13137 / CBS 260.88 / M93) TaxID=1509407 RepID=A0A0L1J4W0_ASPN3|nr:monooxygenase [Aspergillus nomiae NRRL 13137]KNG86777.1 monooxygenase [Aspergillus nomiae NRRL 13137]